MQKTSKIWMDGRLVPWDRANVHILTHTLHYGLAAFEGIRAYATDGGEAAVFRLRDHVRRLMESCRAARMEPPFDAPAIERAIEDLIRANGLAECYIRPLVAVGPGEMGVARIDNPKITAIAAYPFGAYLGPRARERGCTARVVSICRHHVNSCLTHAKLSGNYVNSILASIEARDFGADEAILLDAQGFLAEGAGENLFLVRDGVVFTPPLATVLAGITRASAIRILGDLGHTVVERSLTRDEIYVADEAFFTGTAAEIVPIREVDRRTVGPGRPGPVTRSLCDAYDRAVRGREPAFAGWNHVVPLGRGRSAAVTGSRRTSTPRGRRSATRGSRARS